MIVPSSSKVASSPIIIPRQSDVSLSPKNQKYAKKAKSRKPRDPKKMTIGEHLQELRRRLMWSALALLSGGSLGYFYNKQIIAWLVKPLNQQLYFTSPAGGFDFLIKICVFFGFLLAIPVLVYQLIKFLSPAVPNHISYKTGKILISSVILAVAGVSFAYFVSLPAALHFLGNFSTGSITSLISANEYFNFVMIYMLVFGVLFQMPLIIYFINKVTPLTPQILMRKQRIVILASFVIAALVTPTPDPLNQTLMALPMIMLYQSSIGVVWQANRHSRRKNRNFSSQMSVASV
ncbi:MAG: twin-arginine translocase subunit TatC [bacterium]|nr:twin-arginine translocase subunit TatC [bacterium]